MSGVKQTYILVVNEYKKRQFTFPLNCVNDQSQTADYHRVPDIAAHFALVTANIHLRIPTSTTL